MSKINASMVVLIIGIGILAASLLADIIGIGDDVGFGPQQTTGTIIGVIVVAVGAYLMKKDSGSSDSGSSDSGSSRTGISE